MTTHTDRIRQMAQEADCLDASGDIFICDADALTRFAQLVAEDCARVAVESRDDALIANNRRAASHQNSGDWERGVYGIGSLVEHEIRARYSLKD